MGPARKKIIQAIESGRAKSNAALSKATGIAAGTLGTHLSAMRREGLITYEKPHRTAISYETIAVARSIDTVAKDAVERAEVTASPASKVLVDSAALAAITSNLRRLADDFDRVIGGASPLLEVMRDLVAAHDVRPVTASVERPAAKQARAPRRSTSTRARKSAAPTPEQPAYRLVNRLGEELATFVDRDAALRGFDASKWATALVDVATGKAIKTKGTPMKSRRAPAGRPALAHADEEE